MMNVQLQVSLLLGLFIFTQCFVVGSEQFDKEAVEAADILVGMKNAVILSKPATGFECSKCEHTYSSLSSLNRHVKAKHPRRKLKS